MNFAALLRLYPMSRFRLALVLAALLAIVTGISWLGLDVMDQIDNESESRSDNAQWALSQIEVELLHLISAADETQHGAATVDKVRLRYDILFSRLETLRVGRVFGRLREMGEYVESMGHLNAFVQAQLPFIDGPDAGLVNHLPVLHAQAMPMIRQARVIAMAGIREIAGFEDRRRTEVARTLILAGGLTVFLVAFLLALVAMLLRLFQFNRLREAENLATLSRLNAVVSTAQEALVTVDSQGRIVDFNESACRTFGFGQNEAVGADMADLVPAGPDDWALFRTGQAPAVEGQGRFRINARHKDGHVCPAEVSISRMTSGEATLYVAFLRDLSAQLAAEQALVVARDEALAGEKAKADLLAVMSHEIRTPLNGLIGTIELLDATELATHQREYLRIMESSGRLLMHHVNDVLNISRLDSGKSRFQMGPVDLAELVHEVVENQTPANRANANVMSYTGPSDGRTLVECDGAQMRQVLLNLVGNAVKFTQNGAISVEISHAGAEGPTEILVRDTGIGIPQADLERIFDDFVTLDATYARPVSGTGLGLGIVRRIVRQMGGNLSVDSQPNWGSTFRVILPLRILDAAQAQAPVATQPGEPDQSAGSLLILVVEDNEFNRLIVREMLANAGHDVVEARDGDEGIALAASRRFDLILMDISMPRVDGLQAARAIRAGTGLSRLTPIVAMTAHALAEDSARFRANGMAEVLLKPMTREALKAVLLSAKARTAMDDPAQPDAGLLDHRVLAFLASDLGSAKASSLLQEFRVEAAAILRRITATALLPDQTAIRDVHRLAGSAAMFGANRLHSTLWQVESAWKAGKTDEAMALTALLSSIWASTDAAFQDVGDLAQSSSLR